MKFIEVRNNTAYFDVDKPELKDICRELIAVDSIQHVYIMLPAEEDICIECRSRKGIDRSIIESFSSRGECHYRFKELSRMLCEEGRADR